MNELSHFSPKRNSNCFAFGYVEHASFPRLNFSSCVAGAMFVGNFPSEAHAFVLVCSP